MSSLSHLRPCVAASVALSFALIRLAIADHATEMAIGPAPDYTETGSFRFRSRRGISVLCNTTPASSDGEANGRDAAGRNYTIKLTVTVPTTCAVESCDHRRAPFPIVLLINGFQMQADYYKAWAQRLASWGFAVVQYDKPWLPIIIEDATEVQFFPAIMDWLRQQNVTPGGWLQGSLKLDNMAAAGHSRGGKLAGLLYAEHPAIRSAFLTDPVDNTAQTPEGPKWPSAVKALRRAGRPFGMLGAGHLGRCNPKGVNFEKFWPVAVNGSWLGVASQSGHSQFADAGWFLNIGIRLLCPGGKVPPAQVQSVALPTVVAWMEQELRPSASQVELLSSFKRWAEQEGRANRLFLTFKGSNKDQLSKVGAAAAEKPDAATVAGMPVGDLQVAVA